MLGNRKTRTTQDVESGGQRFARFARALFAIPKAEMAEALARDEGQPKIGGGEKRKPGPAKGAPNWRTRRKQQAEDDKKPAP